MHFFSTTNVALHDRESCLRRWSTSKSHVDDANREHQSAHTDALVYNASDGLLGALTLDYAIRHFSWLSPDLHGNVADAPPKNKVKWTIIAISSAMRECHRLQLIPR